MDLKSAVNWKVGRDPPASKSPSLKKKPPFQKEEKHTTAQKDRHLPVFYCPKANLGRDTSSSVCRTSWICLKFGSKVSRGFMLWGDTPLLSWNFILRHRVFAAVRPDSCEDAIWWGVDGFSKLHFQIKWSQMTQKVSQLHPRIPFIAQAFPIMAFFSGRSIPTWKKHLGCQLGPSWKLLIGELSYREPSGSGMDWCWMGYGFHTCLFLTRLPCSLSS